MPSSSIRWSLLLLPACIQAVTLDCAQIRDDGHTFNLEKLGGPKQIHVQDYRKLPPTITNTTITIDICQALKDPDSKKDEKCPNGTRVCEKAVEYREGKDPYLDRVIAVAGDFTTSRGPNRALDPKFTRLKGSASNNDNKEGVIVEMNGGKFPDKRSGKPQKAIIEFLCDKKVSGNEGFAADGSTIATPIASATATKSAAPVQSGVQPEADDDEDDGPDLPDLDKGKNLKFISYHEEGDTDVLRLQWRTKFACEDVQSSGSSTKGWGFFTWFIIVLFLLAASYIIFGSWLNYNRYGARGWDLIPHGDTIRDIPYLVKDIGGDVVDKLKGQGGNRGGYSAV